MTGVQTCALPICIKFVLLKKVGKAVIDRTVTDDDIIKALEEIHYVEDCE